MANPSPQPTPTTGLNVAAYVQLAGTGVTALHAPSTGHPNPGPYAVTLSLTGAGGFASSVVVTPSLVDVANTSYGATAASWVYRSFNNPLITETCFSSLAPSISYTAKIASTSANGSSTVTVTPLAKGQAIVGVYYPVFDNTEGSINVSTGFSGANVATAPIPIGSIYADLIVTVIP